MEKIRILYIDDEVNNLNSFKATFRFDYSILTAVSAAEAKSLLEEYQDIKIILCDQRISSKACC